jgi:hypothetical protein
VTFPSAVVLAGRQIIFFVDIRVSVAGPPSSSQFSFRSQMLLPSVHLAQDFLAGLLSS